MKQVCNLLSQDLKLLLRNAIFWVISVSLVLIVITVNWLVPAEAELDSRSLVVYGMQLPVPGVQVAESPEAVRELVENTDAIGLINTGGGLTVVHSGLSDQAIAALVSQLTPLPEDQPPLNVQALRQSERTTAQNLRMVPMFVSFEAVILGFLMAAILLLGEKQEGTLRAYRVSPGGTLAYVVSKSLLFVLVGTAYAALMVVTTIGFAFNWGQFLLLTVLGCLLYTLLGLSLAVFFQDISGWFFLATLILALNMLPMVSFAVPSFSPGWMQSIPSYGGLFAYEEILFPTGRALGGTFAALGTQALAAFALCMLLVKRKLLSAE